MEPIDDETYKELSEPTPDRPVGDLSLQQELAKYQKSLEEEWETENLVDPENHEQLVEKTRKQLIRGIPVAVANLIYLAEHGDNENVRLRAQIYLIDNGLGETGKFNPVDPMEALINKLTAPKND